MWERFSFYGMRALLVLFMVDAVTRGGMGLTDEVATAIYGLYTAAVYLAALPGGWIADRFLGGQRSVWWGGIVIACGHFTLAVPRTECFYLGLILVVVGTGLLKPNVSAICGELYPEGGARRDAGFTVFYMGINLGAALGPLVCSALGERINWHYGFAAAGVGMVLGLLQYSWSRRHLGEAGRYPGHRAGVQNKDRVVLFTVTALVVLAIVLAFVGVIRINPVALAGITTYLIVLVACVYFLLLFFLFHLDATEKKRIAVIAILFVSSAMFWSGFEQAGSSLNLFAERYTERFWFHQLIPAGWFQALGPIFIISLAPLIAAVWIALARRNWEPSLATKFAWGLILLATGFLVRLALRAW
jgi:POT family proton-dependent oligopeptide transporter